ncbi:effector-associated constant component EACC1 [Streptomyces alkaliterrae]|uniref:Uncharacterized protein n=1 Tax=Streptomyces alkaliterrae TaxID=2213162 RepID=A0A5P0YP40_9ACTN|nr:hypothetical protein [Streptomyces alkaliterrae]MBB1260012.1 hypothetical protein [Streptomyces alkaliterrae]MQS02124.1 hypothetical protein [Streptomyces alkaliterrae]
METRERHLVAGVRSDGNVHSAADLRDHLVTFPELRPHVGLRRGVPGGRGPGDLLDLVVLAPPALVPPTVELLGRVLTEWLRGRHGRADVEVPLPGGRPLKMQNIPLRGMSREEFEGYTALVVRRLALAGPAGAAGGGVPPLG